MAGGPQFSWESHRLGPIPAIFFPTLFFVLKDTARFPVSSLVLLCSPFCGSISLSQVCDCFSGSPLPTEDWVFLIPALRLELVTLTGSLLLAQSSGFHVQCGPLRPPLGPTYAPAARVSLAPLGGIRGVLAAPGFISLGTSPSLSYEALFQSFAHAALRGLSLARWPLPQRLLRVVMALRTPALPPTHVGTDEGDRPAVIRIGPHRFVSHPTITEDSALDHTSSSTQSGPGFQPSPAASSLPQRGFGWVRPPYSSQPAFAAGSIRVLPFPNS